MAIPWKADNPWVRMVIAFASSANSPLDVSKFKAKLGPGQRWIITDGVLDNPKAFLLLEEENERIYAKASTSGNPPNKVLSISLAAAVDAIAQAIPAGCDLIAGVNAQFRYPPEVKWRLPILAEPPALEANDLGLGKMSLIGISLRFSDAPLAVAQTTLGASFVDNFREVELIYSVAVKAADLVDIFRLVAERGHSLAALFVESEAAPRKAQPVAS